MKTDEELSLRGIDLNFVETSTRDLLEGETPTTIVIYGLSLLVRAEDTSITVLFPNISEPDKFHDLSARQDGGKRFNAAERWTQVGSGELLLSKSSNPWSAMDRILDLTAEAEGKKLGSVMSLLKSGQIQAALTLRGGTLQAAFPLSAVGQGTLWKYRGAFNLYTDLAVFSVPQATELSWTSLDGGSGSRKAPKALLFANVDSNVQGSDVRKCERLTETAGYYALLGVEDGEIPTAESGIGKGGNSKIHSGTQGCLCNLGRVDLRGWTPDKGSQS